MKQLVDQNPAARLVLIGVLAVAVMFLVYARVLRSSDEAGTSQTAATKPAPSRTAPPQSSSAAGRSTAPGGGGVKLQPSQGLPAEVASAYNQGKVVVVLVSQRDGVIDRSVRDAARRLEARKSVALFQVAVPDVSDYARLTSGVNIDRAPALIVVAPNQTSQPPKAIVKQGFVDSASMLQAVNDAIHPGRSVPPYPE